MLARLNQRRKTMTDPNPLTEPRKKLSRAKKVRDGLFLVAIGVAGFLLFLVINSAAHIRILPLAGIAIIVSLIGLAAVVMALTQNDQASR
jgi:hypothetical protein